VQLKIKIALAPELTPAQIPPFDYGKIARFSIAVLMVIGLCLYAVFSMTLSNTPEQELRETPLIVDDKPLAADVIAPPVVIEQAILEPAITLLIATAPKVTVPPTITELVAESAPAIPVIEPVVPADINISSQHIKRALLTSAIIKREPTDSLGGTVDITRHQKVYLYSHLLGLAGHKVEHRWYYQQQLIATIPLTIGSHNWRTYSSKYLDRMMLGQWRVEVVKRPNTIIAVHRFDVHH